MPLPLLAHQAPILPLKLRWPAAWNGTALVIGSVAPDLAYLRMARTTDAALALPHSIAGQVIFCLPVTVALVWIIGRLRLGEVLAARLGPRFLWLAGAATDVVRPGGLRRAAVSALVGSSSHVALDALTHTWLLRFLPPRVFHFAGLTCGTGTLVQLLASVVLAAVALQLFVLIARRASGAMPARRPGRLLVVGLALAGAVAGACVAAPAVRNPDAYFEAGRLYVLGLVAFFAAVCAGGGVLTAGLILASSDFAQRKPTP